MNQDYIDLLEDGRRAAQEAGLTGEIPMLVPELLTGDGEATFPVLAPRSVAGYAYAQGYMKCAFCRGKQTAGGEPIAHHVTCPHHPDYNDELHDRLMDARGERIHEAAARLRSGLTEDEVAQALGVSLQEYRQLEADPGEMTIDQAMNLGATLGVDIDSLDFS